MFTATDGNRAIADFFPGKLGVELTDISPEEARGRLTVDRRHLHPGGYVHGGVWVAFADTVAAWGTIANLQDSNAFTTIELKTNLFGSARVGDELFATATPLHRGRSTYVWEVRITKGGKPAAFFTCTQMVLAPAE
jgi:1,4-dihydroxy-2-naphthoyl-CoA hydrolase